MLTHALDQLLNTPEPHADDPKDAPLLHRGRVMEGGIRDSRWLKVMTLGLAACEDG